MKCIVCGKELEAGDLIVKFQGLKMATPVSVESGIGFSGGVVHVECLSGLPDQVEADLTVCASVSGR